MTFPSCFDAVIMLTWSDWKTEPRSNRYHYATRFARQVPVLFLQHQSIQRSQLTTEPTEIENIDVVNISVVIGDRDIAEFKKLMRARGIRRPLVWIYDSMNYQPLLDAMPSAFRVYHATEDYLTKSDGWNGGWSSGMDLVGRSVVRLLEQVDFMVACTQGVADSYVNQGQYAGRYAVIENGCDAEYFIDFSQQHRPQGSPGKAHIAIFQGGINSRLDYNLMHTLIQRMPNWQFRFCGNAVPSDAWAAILKLPNVKYYGALKPQKFAQLMCESTVGIITYIQDQWIRNSLPLKAYEYVACGLPVVSIPIAALERDPELMTIASTPEAFEKAMLAVAPSRFDPVLLERRRDAAMGRSYNSRFQSMCAQLQEATGRRDVVSRRLKLAMLYDSAGSLHVSTIAQHLDAFGKYSDHDISYVPATPGFWNLPPEKVHRIVDFAYFDAVVVHYSVRVSIREHLDEGLARALEQYQGFKILFIQDEYEGTEIARQWIDRLQFDLVYTCVPASGVDKVYPPYRFSGTEFLPTLTGYIPENLVIEQHAQPLANRKLLLAYRGRKLPAIYGDLGYDKYRIGVEMKRLAEEAGVSTDIEVDDSKRIYGSAWYEFLGSARATLGTESGANVFDFDGSLKTAIAALEAREPGIAYADIAARILAPHEGLVHMNQVSPKIFEAICLRTALVLFEGAYSDAVLPDLHYIPLKKDFSNVQDVFRKLQDTSLLQQMTELAYQDIVVSGKFSYKRFIQSFDADLSSRVLHGSRRRRLTAPLFFAAPDGTPRQALPAMPSGLIDSARAATWTLADCEGISSIGLAGKGLVLNRDLAQAWHETETDEPFAVAHPVTVSAGNTPSRAYRNLQRAWHLLPLIVRIGLARHMRKMVLRNQAVSQPKSVFFRMTRQAWHVLPHGLRIRLARILERG